MSSSLLEQVVAGEAPDLMRLTVEQYHKMLSAGVLHDGDPVELIDGYLVWKDRRDSTGGREMVHGPEHAMTVKRLYRCVDRRLDERLCHAQCQLPITIPPQSEPEPDVSIVAGRPEDYSSRLSNAADTLAVMEVADSSLRHDRTTKKYLYADSGIPAYIVVDLVSRQVELYTHALPGKGRYGQQQTFKAGETICLELAGGLVLELPVAEVLP